MVSTQSNLTYQQTMMIVWKVICIYGSSRYSAVDTITAMMIKCTTLLGKYPTFFFLQKPGGFQ